MKERPILFSAPMVRAILEGRKTQTRRVVKPQPVQLPDFNRGGLSYNVRGSLYRAWTPAVMDPRCPYGQPGDRLWVRETFGTFTRDGVNYESPWYRADADSYGLLGHDGVGPVYSERVVWRPSIHMPRWASRILLEITGVRVERLNDISEADCAKEGAPFSYSGFAPEDAPDWRGWYRHLWESLAGPGSWNANPWVWVVEFRRVTP